MDDHYFSADPSVPFDREPFTCEVWGHELALVSGSGVFSRGHLDHATAVLFRELEPPVQGQFLDLGCGYGVIGLAIAAAVPLANVTAVDVNERALLLANENAHAAGVDGRFVACRPDQVPPDATYDEIWSNPPIRIGKQALHELLLTWLPRLRPEGRMVMVVGKNLGADSLQRWLGEQGWPTTRLASAQGVPGAGDPARLDPGGKHRGDTGRGGRPGGAEHEVGVAHEGAVGADPDVDRGIADDLEPRWRVEGELVVARLDLPEVERAVGLGGVLGDHRAVVGIGERDLRPAHGGAVLVDDLPRHLGGLLDRRGEPEVGRVVARGEVEPHLVRALHGARLVGDRDHGEVVGRRHVAEGVGAVGVGSGGVQHGFRRDRSGGGGWR